MDIECLTGTLGFCEIFRKASRRWMSPYAPPPPLVSQQAGQKGVIERLQLARILNTHWPPGTPQTYSSIQICWIERGNKGKEERERKLWIGEGEEGGQIY